jgi:hypothetical protein
MRSPSGEKQRPASDISSEPALFTSWTHRPPPLAPRERPPHCVLHVHQPELFQELSDPPGLLRLGNARLLEDEQQVVVHGEAPEHAGLLHIAQENAVGP